MPKREIIVRRNTNIKIRYNEISKKHPQWRHGAIMGKIAGEFYLSLRTIGAIINNEGIYSLSA